MQRAIISTLVRGEGRSPRHSWLSLLVLLSFQSLFVLSGCSSKVLKADNSQEILKSEQFDNALNVEALPVEDQGSGTYVRLPGPAPVPSDAAVPTPQATPAPPPIPPEDRANDVKKIKPTHRVSKEQKGKEQGSVSVQTAPPPVRLPEFEDSEGFHGRRPIKDPFRIGEKVTLEASYFSVVAGEMTMETRAFVNVYGRKSYQFAGVAQSTSVFALFYAVDDWFETYVDYETLIPYSYALHVKESKQLREVRTLFDWDKGRAFFWDKKINSEKKLEEKEYDWEILPYSQNIFSALYYLRTFALYPGKKFAYRVAHEKENLMVTGEVIRRETISTQAGTFDTLVVKPKIEINGVFKPVGDIFIWLTNDDRKFVVRIEAKIKIGKVVAEAKKIEPGAEPK